MKKILLASLTLCLVSAASSQSSDASVDFLNKPCPNFVFDTLFNHKKQKVSISDMKGKFVILDCWATFCKPCITSMPKMEQIQKRFGDTLEILMVGLDGYPRIKQFFELRKKENRPVNLPSAASRKMVSYFKTNGVPYYIWIDDKGIVKAITDEVTEEGVSEFIHQGKIKDRQRSMIKPLSLPKTAFLLPVVDSIDRSDIVVNSTLTKYIPELENLMPTLKAKYITTKIRIQNHMISTLYCFAYGDLEKGMVKYNSRALESAHNEKLSLPQGADYDEWKHDNLYCYELTVSESRKNDLLKIMQDDLKRFFGYKAYKEYRTQKCLILSVEKKVDMSTKSPNSEPYIKLNGITGGEWKNQPISKMVDIIHHYRQDKFVLDETGITGNLDFEIKADLTDIDSINNDLKRYGLKLYWADRKVEMFVIRDPD
jgi:thiol-disulfide isomerase/thioredoxin